MNKVTSAKVTDNRVGGGITNIGGGSSSIGSGSGDCQASDFTGV